MSKKANLRVKKRADGSYVVIAQSNRRTRRVIVNSKAGLKKVIHKQGEMYRRKY